MLDIKGLKIRIGDRLLFEAKDISLQNGTYALVGRNGAGKSTLFNVIIDAHKDYDGVISFNGTDLKELKSDFAKTISIVKTHPQVYGNHSVEDVLWLGRLPYQNLFGVRNKADKQIIDKVINDLALNKYAALPYERLSDGEKQLVMIGRAMAQDTPVILLDEPLAFLDLVNQREVMKLLSEIGQSKLVIFSTHHIQQLTGNCKDVLLIQDKKLDLIGEEKDFSAEIERVFKLEN